MTNQFTSGTAHVVRGMLLALVLCSPALSQTPAPPVASTANLSGPRFGATFLTDGIVDKLQKRDIEVSSLITQFGWQFEKLFYGETDGVSAMTEWVVLVGGLEKGVVLPSVSWMVGLRARNGLEFGLGPNLTPTGVALALAAGVTFQTSTLNVPVNIAVVPSKSGVRVSVLSGFSLRRR